MQKIQSHYQKCPKFLNFVSFRVARNWPKSGILLAQVFSGLLWTKFWVKCKIYSCQFTQFSITTHFSIQWSQCLIKNRGFNDVLVEPAFARLLKSTTRSTPWFRMLSIGTMKYCVHFMWVVLHSMSQSNLDIISWSVINHFCNSIHKNHHIGSVVLYRKPNLFKDTNSTKVCQNTSNSF